MVHLDLGRSNDGLLEIARDLANRLQAKVIGIAACQPVTMAYGEGHITADLIEQDRAEIEAELRAAEANFRSAFQNHGEALEWRSSVSYASLADYVAREARAADLVITGVATGDLFDATRTINQGDLVMHAGRPVLLVPIATSAMHLEQAVVGWKDTRETRRATFDAIPLLRLASRVTVVEIASEDKLAHARARLADVVAWLERHGVKAVWEAVAATGDDIAQLNLIAQEHHADLIVAGAYGHRRAHEWALGGVTRDLLLRPNRCALVSH